MSNLLGETHSFICFPIFLLNFLWLHPTSPHPQPLIQAKLPSHSKATFLPWHGFSLHIFNLSWFSHSFPFIWKTSSAIPIYKIEKLLSTFVLASGLSLSHPVSQCFLIASFYLIYSSLWSLTPSFSPARLVSALDDLCSIKFCFCSWCGVPFFLQTYLGWPPSLLCSIDLIFLFGYALAWFFKITEIASFESVEATHKDPFLALYFSLFSSMIFLILCLRRSAAVFMLTASPFCPPLPWSLLMWGLLKKL